MVGNQAYQKSVNLALVMRSIRFSPGVSRTEIATATGLTKSTVGNLVGELAGAGFIREERIMPAKGGGRPRIGLHLVPGRVRVLGVDLRADGFSMVVEHLDGTRTDHFHERFSDTGQSMNEIWEAFRAVADTRVPDGISGISVAVPATVDTEQGRILAAEDFDIEDFEDPVVDIGGERIPVVLENDANAVAWGALGDRNLSGSTAANLLVVTGRREPGGALRVGTAVVTAGRVFYGRDFGGGEFRAAAWRRGMRTELATAGEDERSAVHEILSNLCVPISMLRPEVIVFAGDLSDRLPLIRDVTANELRDAYVDPAVSGAEFMAAGEGSFAIAAGASHMFIEHLFAVPSLDYHRPAAIPGWGEL